MKNYVRFFAGIALLIALSLLLIAGISMHAETGSEQAVRMNSIVQNVREHWGDPEYLAEKYPDVHLLVFGGNDTLLYSQDDTSQIDSAVQAMTSGYICAPVHDGEKFLGTAAILDPALADETRLKRSLRITACAIFAAIMLVLAVIGWYVRRCIIMPFQKMKTFAGNIADGKLDEPLMMERSNLFGVFTESFDIMREALRESRKREEAMKQREKELIASLSHDMKTPVTGIKLLCELLAVKTDDLYVREKVQNINQKAEQLNILVSDLLNAALDELGEMHVNCQDQSAEVLHTLVMEHDTRGLANEMPIPECLICIDRNRVSQVIANIISNSYKYADTAIDIHYSFAECFLKMELTDHGGIPAEELEHLTAKFYRGKTNSAGKDGSGLGLYIAAALMKKMNGDLICSGGNEGLTVTLMIPLS